MMKPYVQIAQFKNRALEWVEGKLMRGTYFVETASGNGVFWCVIESWFVVGRVQEVAISVLDWRIAANYRS